MMPPRILGSTTIIVGNSETCFPKTTGPCMEKGQKEQGFKKYIEGPERPIIGQNDTSLHTSCHCSFIFSSLFHMGYLTIFFHKIMVEPNPT